MQLKDRKRPLFKGVLESQFRKRVRSRFESSGLLDEGGCSGALAGAGDSDVDELGDGDDGHSGIEDDAETES